MHRSRSFNPEPLAYFLTWTTYASWLPGDARGWSDRSGVVREPSLRLHAWAAHRVAARPVSLSGAERRRITAVIMEQCRGQQWDLLAVSCRVQHVHMVVAAPGQGPEAVSRRLKAATARAVPTVSGGNPRVWTRGCSRRRIWNEDDLAAVVEYVTDCQDRPHH